MKKILVLAVLVAVGCASLSKLKPYYDEAKTVIGYVMDRIEYDDPKEEPAPDAPPAVTPPAPEGQVVVKPGHGGWYGKKISSDGHGLYKPWDYHDPMNPGASKLWLLPARIQPGDIKTVGIYRADGSLVRWCNWPNGIGPWSGKPIDGSQVYADPTHPFGWRSHMPAKGSGIDHAGRVKIRQARPPENGMELRCIDIFGQVVARMPISDINIRHEGRLK